MKFDPKATVPPLSLLLLGIAAAGQAIDEVVPDCGGPPRLPVSAPVLRLLLGVLVLRDKLDRALSPAPIAESKSESDPLGGILR